MMDRITASQINWNAVAFRLTKFRELLGFDRQKFADKLGVDVNKITSYESGRKRKTFGTILKICERCRLSPRWVLIGTGHPFRKPEEPPVVDPLKIDKGAGVRRSSVRKDAEEGVMEKEMLDFVLAVDEFKRKNGKPFPSTSDIFQVVRYLGYRKTVNKLDHIDQ